MAVSKVIVNNVTRVDLTSDTVAEDKLLSGYTAHDASGTAITGTATGGTDGQPIRNDVTFMDYDGTVLYGYSATAFASLTEMPANPSHTGLTAQGWNWDLTSAKSYVATYGKILIGQNYITSDGKTRVYIKIEDTSLLKLRLTIAKNSNVSGFDAAIDWGDGNTSNNIGTTSTTPVGIVHEYASIGEYTIAITVNSGKIDFRCYAENYFFLQPYDGNYGNVCKAYCALVQKIELGDNFGVIGQYAFQSCTQLKTITIPKNITIGGYAFRLCYNLKAIVLNTGFHSSASYVFYQCYALTSVTIGNASGYTWLPYYGFTNCRSLRYFTISDVIDRIDTYAFQDCHSLEDIIIPNSVTDIGSYAFNNCRSATNLYLSTSISNIPSYAFQYCASLTKVIIPSNVTVISSNAFEYCGALDEVVLNEGIVTIQGYVFRYCYNLSKINFPSTLKTISNAVFYNATLTEVIIPSTVTSLSNNTFSYNYALSKIQFLPNFSGATDFGYMFQACSSLPSVTVPSCVTTLGSAAFNGCLALREIHFKSSTPPTATSSNTFYQVPNICKIYVPSGSLSAYTSATNYPSSSTYTYVTE